MSAKEGLLTVRELHALVRDVDDAERQLKSAIQHEQVMVARALLRSVLDRLDDACKDADAAAATLVLPRPRVQPWVHPRTGVVQDKMLDDDRVVALATDALEQFKGSGG